MQSAGIFMRPQVILGDCVPLWCFTTPCFPCFIRLFSAEGRNSGKGTRQKKWGTCLFEKLFVFCKYLVFHQELFQFDSDLFIWAIWSTWNLRAIQAFYKNDWYWVIFSQFYLQFQVFLLSKKWNPWWRANSAQFQNQQKVKTVLWDCNSFCGWVAVFLCTTFLQLLRLS